MKTLVNIIKINLSDSSITSDINLMDGQDPPSQLQIVG